MWSNKDSQYEKVDMDDDPDDLIPIPKESKQVNNDIQPELNERTRNKIYRQLKRLESSFNPEASKIIENIEQGREVQLDQTNLAFFSTSPSEIEPTSFNKVWNHPDPKNRELWRIAINKELGEMENKKVWEVINQEDVPKERFLKLREMAYFELVGCLWL